MMKRLQRLRGEAIRRRENEMKIAEGIELDVQEFNRALGRPTRRPLREGNVMCARPVVSSVQNWSRKPVVEADVSYTVYVRNLIDAFREWRPALADLLTQWEHEMKNYTPQDAAKVRALHAEGEKLLAASRAFVEKVGKLSR